MRILQVQGLMGGGGSEVHTYLLSRGLVQRGHEVVFCAPDVTSPLFGQVSAAGCEVARFPLLPTWRRVLDIATIRRLAELARSREIDVIHTHMWNADIAGFAAGRLSGTPVVATLHGPTIAISIRRTWLHRVHLALHARILRRMTRLIAISEFTRDFVAEELGLSADGMDVVHNCSDVSAYEHPVDRAEVRKRIGVPADAVVLVIVGELTARKGILEFIEAAARIRQAVGGAHFVVVGRGWLEEQARKRAVEFGVADAVHFLGWREDIPELLGASDVLAVTSYKEGFGRTMTEAMSSSLPVVAFDSGAPREIVVDGETGFLVPEGDVESLARRAIQLLEDAPVRERMGAAGHERARRLFDVASFVESTEAILAEAAARPGRGMS